MTCTPFPTSTLKYTGSVATSVLPSPVFISAMPRLLSTMPPISCTSKCRIFMVRDAASRTAAKASGRISWSVSPFASRSRKRAVCPLSSSVESPLKRSSSAFIASTWERVSRMIFAPGFPVRFLRENMRVCYHKSVLPSLVIHFGQKGENEKTSAQDEGFFFREDAPASAGDQQLSALLSSLFSCRFLGCFSFLCCHIRFVRLLAICFLCIDRPCLMIRSRGT